MGVAITVFLNEIAVKWTEEKSAYENRKKLRKGWVKEIIKKYMPFAI